MVINRGLGKSAALLVLLAIVLGGTSFASAAPIRISCVGDSITFGIVPKRLHNAWPVVLGRILGHRYKTLNCGHSGATMLKKGDIPYWKTAQFKWAIHFKPNIVIIMLGTNDTKPWNWDKHGKDFEANTISMINLFKKLPTHPKVYICYPPKILKPSYHIIEANLVRGVIPAITKAAHVTHTPIINVFAKLPGIPKYYDRDGVHPNIKGEAIMAHIIAKAIRH